jgi:hypothetical protein
VDILQSLHSVIESPNKVIDMTNDEGKTEDVGEGPTTTNEDRNEQESYYKLICFRFALSCSLKLRKHKHTSPGSSDSGRYVQLLYCTSCCTLSFLTYHLVYLSLEYFRC